MKRQKYYKDAHTNEARQLGVLSKCENIENFIM